MRNRSEQNSLNTIAIVPLYNQDFLSGQNTLFWCHEAKGATCAGVCLLVAVRDTHATTCHHVEASQMAILVDHGNEADVMCVDVDIIGRWNCNSNFELKRTNQVLIK
jgi:hypothetical protein